MNSIAKGASNTVLLVTVFVEGRMDRESGVGVVHDSILILQGHCLR